MTSSSEFIATKITSSKRSPKGFAEVVFNSQEGDALKLSLDASTAQALLKALLSNAERENTTPWTPYVFSVTEVTAQRSGNGLALELTVGPDQSVDLQLSQQTQELLADALK